MAPSSRWVDLMAGDLVLWPPGRRWRTVEGDGRMSVYMRRRSRRWATGAAAAAVSCGLALVGCGGHAGTAEPGRSSTPPTGASTRASIDTASSTRATLPIPRPITHSFGVDGAPALSLALTALRSGRRPGIPWLEGTTLHLPGRDVTTAPYLTYDPTPSASAPYGAGAVVELWDRNPLIIWYDAAGRQIRESASDGLTWSPTHHEVVWTSARGTVVLASSTTGRILHRYSAPRGTSPRPAGWLDDGDILFPVGWNVPRGWRTSSNTVTAEPASPIAVSARRSLVAGVLGRTRGSDTLCLAVWNLDHPEAVTWDGCLVRGGRTYSVDTGGSFSPHGRLIATSAWSIARGPSRPFVAVMDSRTGRVVARLDEGRDDGGFRGPEYAVSAMRWEDDTHLLLVVADRTEATIGPSGEIQPHQALVRCDVHALTCELATTPRTTSQWETAPYGLVG
jgi:hypothetical protein